MRLFVIVATALAATASFALAGSVYRNTRFGVVLNYAGLPVQEKEIASYIPPQSYLRSSTQTLLTLYLNPTVYEGTNLENGSLRLSANGTLTQDKCYRYQNTDGVNVYATYVLDRTRTVQGNSWRYTDPQPLGGAALGHQSAGELYRLYKNRTCFEVVLQLSTVSRANFDNPDFLKEANTTKMFNYLGATFNRLQIR